METNSAGQITLARSYDPWGNLDATSATVGGLAFTGREWDAETGLYDHRARYYEPRLASFISADPLGLRVSENLYQYSDGDPVSVIDPFGLKGFKWNGECARLGVQARIGGCSWAERHT